MARRRAAGLGITALAAILLGCGVHRQTPALPSPKSEPARAVVQTRVEPDTYLVQTASGRFAVFGQTVVDLEQRRVSWTDLDGVVGVPAAGDQVYRAREDHLVELLDLRIGSESPVGREQAEEIMRKAPEQSWSSHAGMIANEALPQLSAETRAIASSLPAVEPAIVLDMDERAERLLTATSARVCLWSMRSFARELCVPRVYQNYALRADGSLLVWQMLASGEEQVGTLRALDAPVAWSTHDAGKLGPGSSLQQPCGLEISSGPTDNLFSRAGHALFTLHDFGADGWALVLPDGHYLADQVPPRGLSFFEADGRLCSPERVLQLHQPQEVRELVAHAAARAANCAF